ncbi:MAG: hypothetical protein PHQ11_07250, partial [Paludibacter sp.]|nr:hypothetical protein [Paludibacter sp.]
MKKIIPGFLSLILSISSVLSQSNFKEGYIITLEQDTISGWIDFRTDQTNARICRFRPTKDAAEKVYRPAEIAGYRFVQEGKYYVSRIIDIENKPDTVFLEFLIQGMRNLYYLFSDNEYFIFEKEDGTLLPVTKRPDQILENYKAKEDNRYKGVMSYLFQDCLPLSRQTARIRFDKGSMIMFAKKYHDRMCDTGEECIIFENDYKRSFIKFDYTFFTGVELNSAKLVNTDFPVMLSISPVVGAGLGISSPRLMKSLYFKMDASIGGISGVSNYIDDYLKYFRYEFSAIKYNLGAGLEYIYDKGKFRPAAGAGISFQGITNLKDTLKINYEVNDYTTPFYNLTTGVKTGLGFDYQVKNDQFIVVRIE